MNNKIIIKNNNNSLKLDKVLFFDINENTLNNLINACKNGNFYLVKSIIESNESNDESNETNDESKQNILEHYNYILNVACKYNNINIVNYLLSLNNNNIDISNNNEIPFLIACENGNLELVKCIINNKIFILTSKYLDSNIYISEHAFIIVCKNGFIDIADWLININPTLNIHVNNDYPLQRACYSSHYNMVKWLLNLEHIKFDLSIWKYEIFINTCLLRYTEICELLIEYDNRIINKFTIETILMDSIDKNKIEIIEWVFNITNITDNNIISKIDFYKISISLCVNDNDIILLFILNNVHINSVDLYKLFCISCKNGSNKTAKILLNIDNSIKDKIDKELYNKCNKKNNIKSWLKEINKDLDNEKYNCFSFCS